MVPFKHRGPNLKLARIGECEECAVCMTCVKVRCPSYQGTPCGTSVHLPVSLNRGNLKTRRLDALAYFPPFLKPDGWLLLMS